MRTVTVSAETVVANVLSRARAGHAVPPSDEERSLAAEIVSRLQPFGIEPSIGTDAFICRRALSGEEGPQPLVCENCGKLMREHGPLANCWPALSGEEG